MYLIFKCLLHNLIQFLSKCKPSNSNSRLARSTSVPGVLSIKEMFAAIVQHVLYYSWLNDSRAPSELWWGWTIGFASPSGASLKPLYFFVNIDVLCSFFWHLYFHWYFHYYSHMYINLIMENGRLRSSKTGMSWLGCYHYCSVHLMLLWLLSLSLSETNS